MKNCCNTWDFADFNYCPNCGSKVKEEKPTLPGKWDMHEHKLNIAKRTNAGYELDLEALLSTVIMIKLKTNQIIDYLKENK